MTGGRGGGGGGGGGITEYHQDDMRVISRSCNRERFCCQWLLMGQLLTIGSIQPHHSASMLEVSDNWHKMALAFDTLGFY